MRPHYRIIPDLLATDSRIPDGAKIFATLVYALMTERGCCWATNDYLAEQYGISSRTARRYIHILQKYGYFIVELEYRNFRKIWSRETWPNKSVYEERYGKDIVPSREEFNQRFDTWDTNVLPKCKCMQNVPGVGHKCPTSLASLYNDNVLDKRYKDGAAPQTSAQEQTVTQAANNEKKPVVMYQQMTKQTAVPVPGPKAMVKETKKLLDEVIHFKGSRYLIHPEDKKYFLGFSPQVIIEAIRRTQNHKGKGKNSIHNLMAYIFAKCCEIRKE